MDAAGNLWLSPYGGGVWRYDGKGVTSYPVKDKLGDGKDTQMFCLFKDNAGGLWLGTPIAEPYRFNSEAFEQFKSKLSALVAPPLAKASRRRSA
jgi:hypothetical protein